MEVNDQTDLYTILSALSSSLANENSIVSVSSKEFKHVERWSKLLDFFRNLDSNNILMKLLVEQLSSLDEFLDHAQIVKILACLIKMAKISDANINEIRSLNRAIIPYLIRLLKEEEDDDEIGFRIKLEFSPLDLAKRKCIEAIIKTKIAKSCLLYYYSERDQVCLVDGIVEIFFSFIKDYDSFTKESMQLSLNFKSVTKLKEKRGKNNLIDFHQGVLIKEDILLQKDLPKEDFACYIFRKGAISKNFRIEHNLEYFQKLWSLNSLKENILLFFQDTVEEKLKDELFKRCRGFCVFDALGDKKINEMKETLGMNVINDIMSITDNNLDIFRSRDLKLKIIEVNKEKHILLTPASVAREKVLTTVVLIKEQNQVIFSAITSTIRSSLHDLFEILNGDSVALNNGNFALKFLLILTKFVYQKISIKGQSSFCNVFVPILLDEIFLGQKYEEAKIVSENDCFKHLAERLWLLKHFTSVEKVESFLNYFEKNLLGEKLNFVTFHNGCVVDLKEGLVDLEEFSDLIENLNKNVEVSLLSKNLREYIYAFKLYDFFVGLYILKENT